MYDDHDDIEELTMVANASIPNLTAVYRPLSEGDSQTSTTPERYSLSEDELDKMVANASIPNLAALMKQGLDSGLISPQPKYK